MYLTKTRNPRCPQKWMPGSNLNLTDVLGLCMSEKFFEAPKIPGDVLAQSIILDLILENGEFIELGNTLIVKKI